MDRLVKLGDFLRSRRARVDPKSVGLAVRGHRRVPGLRREELAQLAGVSVDYYTRLEQGRSKNASPVVLDAIARALQLGETEREHLFDLANPICVPSRCGTLPPQRVRQETHILLGTLEHADIPAAVIGLRTDILAANLMFRALMVGFETMSARERNLARFVFLDPASRELHLDWEIVAADATAMLRFSIGRYPHDPGLHDLTRELCLHSEDFRRIWDEHHVLERISGTKRYRHPAVGEFTLGYQALTLPGDADQMLLIYTDDPDSPSGNALQLLAKWARSSEYEAGSSQPDRSDMRAPCPVKNSVTPR
ncbi:helix-turn-helix transcriptional regulator [Planotetraspora kaengkrachanensis]|uniref:Transcriptional regulator n=1 Tax=Planotetraspora kaengkrachanensis TaxID=575193 RepID=A0A8J3PUJ1_9ACTN|nr:helix-turn-helix transcriptional regulator [Planotetraspora kaengkrachanensis]GIG81331.1 transcriptional regulator [Planotetraspora kaengkrachanensis]